MAEKYIWDQANILQKLGLVWRNRKKIRPNYQRLLLLTVLPLNYFMDKRKIEILHAAVDS